MATIMALQEPQLVLTDFRSAYPAAAPAPVPSPSPELPVQLQLQVSFLVQVPAASYGNN